MHHMFCLIIDGDALRNILLLLFHTLIYVATIYKMPRIVSTSEYAIDVSIMRKK